MAGIHIQKSHEGLLHAHLGIPKGKKISLGTLMKAKRSAKASGDTKTEKQATFAQNARTWNHS